MKNIVIALFLVLFIYPCVAMADLGPKPTMEFNFSNLPNGIKIISGQQFECADKNCFKKKPLGYLNQRFSCGNSYCSSLALYDNYHKLVINFSDKTRTSNIFSATALNSKFEVKINPDESLSINDVTPLPERFRIKDFLVSFLITVILELLVAKILFVRKKPNVFLPFVLYANTITLPVFWFFMLYHSSMTLASYYSAEAVIIIFEGIFIKIFTKQTLADSFMLSIIMNLVSVFIGGFIASIVIIGMLR